MEADGRSLAETPTYAVATVVTVMVSLGFFFQVSLKQAAKWLDRTKRKSLLAALEKIKQELMLFGLLSLLMGHWIEFVAKICVKSSALSSRFYPCARDADYESSVEDVLGWPTYFLNHSVYKEQVAPRQHNYCHAGHESFASYESLEQLHRFLFVLAVIHVSYSFATIALAMIKIYSWTKWEHQAKTMAVQGSLGCLPREVVHSSNIRIMRLSTFIFHHTSHPWSHHRVLVWLLCFSRQFWSSINRPDYMALRLGFITTHELPLSYDFHNYMLRSMEEEFRDIVGISVPLWIYAILCIFLDFHGSNIYFWISFLPSILILLVGTKLHRIILKLAVEITDSCSIGERQFHLRDDLFWFGKPRLLLWFLQFISFLNAFEMATFIWSLWEIRGTSCFMDNHRFLVIRLIFGVVSQFWCSFVTFPLYVIVTQMGSRFKKTVVSENVRRSLHGWHRRAKAKHAAPLLSTMSVTSLDSLTDIDPEERFNDLGESEANIIEATTSFDIEEDISVSNREGNPSNQEIFELPLDDDEVQTEKDLHSCSSGDSFGDDDDSYESLSV